MDLDSTPPALQQAIEDEDALPEKSKERYELKYISYCTWRSEYGASQTTEDVFLAYLAERSKRINPASLWSEQSIIRTMVKLREHVDVKKMNKVKHFLKQNGKNYTPKQPRTLTDKECIQFLKEAPDNNYLMLKVALVIGLYGACRKYEMTAIQVEYLKFGADYIAVTIPKTRNVDTRSFVVPNSIDGIQMAELMKKYISLRPAHTPHTRLFIFYEKGKCGTSPVGKNTIAKIPAKIAQYLKLPEANVYTGHCFRRMSANLLANAGGWKSSTSKVSNRANVNKTDEEMNYEAHLQGSSTPPSLLQDSVISPIKIESREEGDFEYADNDDRISLILNKEFSFQQEQLPLKITDDEYKVMKEIVCNDDVFRNATLLTKVHCTVCDTHLGASPIAQFDRFVHPVLNTLMCESCFVFYNSDEFPKDEDGSEIYCKWCGQGGTVMCCSDCPLVFCKDCVERNFGERVCEKIVNADTWQCFKCNPSQLSKLHIMCSAVHEYTLKIIENPMITGDLDILEKDISICCKEDSTTTNKRKHIVLDDELDLDDIPIASRKRMKMCHDLNGSLSTPVTLVDKKSAPSTRSVQSSSPPPLVPVVSSKYTAISQDPPPLRPLTSVITNLEGNVSNTIKSNTNTENRTSDSVLLNNSVDKTQEVIDTLTIQCEYIRQAMRIPKNEAQYAELRNSMQHVLHQCSNLLLESRKVVLMDEILPSSNTNIKKVPVRILSADNKTAVTSVDGAACKKSTIILRYNGTNALAPALSGLNAPNQLKRVLRKAPGSPAQILITPTLTPITRTGLKPLLVNQVQPTNTVRLINNVKNNSLAISQVGPETVGNIVPSSMVSAATKNIYDKHVIGAKKTKTDVRDPLAMSDDESEGSWIKTETDTFIDEPIMVKVEVDET